MERKVTPLVGRYARLLRPITLHIAVVPCRSIPDYFETSALGLPISRLLLPTPSNVKNDHKGTFGFLNILERSFYEFLLVIRSHPTV